MKKWLAPPVGTGGLCGDADLGYVGGASCSLAKGVLTRR
jgi:hypothetical protein